jgi:hypothetical protein
MSILLSKIRGVVVWSSGRRLLVLVPCFVLTLWLISFSPWWFSEATIKADHGVGTLDLQFGGSSDRARATLDQLGSAGRDAYDAFQIVDIVFPLTYALALSGLIWSTWRGPARPWVLLLATVPIAGATFDYVENVLVRLALSSYPNTSDGVLTAGAAVTTIKLSLSYVSQALVAVGLVLAAIRALRRRISNAPDAGSVVGA